MNKQARINITRSKGFNLIEILVTMLIMAVGLLGISALQFRGLQYSQDAYVRSQVNFLAYDIADRIRLNRANALDYVGNHIVNPAVAPVCVQSTGANAANDLGCWRELAYASLPAGSKAHITQAAGVYRVDLGWTDKGNITHTVTYSFQP